MGVLDPPSVGGAALPWMFDIISFMPATTVGTWAFGADSNDVFCGSEQSSGAQNDSADYITTLSKGTWSLSLMYVKGANRGIYTISLDDGAGSFANLDASPWNAVAGTGAVDGSHIDGYNATTTRNNVATVTGIVIPSAKKRTLRLTMATRNASNVASPGFFSGLQHIKFTRTA